MMVEQKEKVTGSHSSDAVVNLDSVKFHCGLSLVSWTDWDRFNHERKKQHDNFKNESVLIKDIWTSRRNDIRGFGRIVIDKIKGEVEFSFSSKMLGCDYRQLMNKDNFLEILEMINCLGLIHFDVQEAFKSGWISSLDITKNVQFGNAKSAKNAINLLGVMSHAKDWIFEKHKHTKGGADGIFTQKGIRLKFYYKLAQIALKTDGKGDIPAYDFVVDNGLEKESSGHVRCEITLRSKAKMLKALGIKNNNIQSVLNAKQCPIVTVYRRIIKASGIRKLERLELKNYSNMGIQESQRFLHVDRLIVDYKSDVNSIRAALLLKNDKAKVSRYINKHVIPEILRRKANEYKKQGCAVYDIRSKLDILEGALVAG